MDDTLFALPSCGTSRAWGGPRGSSSPAPEPEVARMRPSSPASMSIVRGRPGISGCALWRSPDATRPGQLAWKSLHRFMWIRPPSDRKQCVSKMVGGSW